MDLYENNKYILENIKTLNNELIIVHDSIKNKLDINNNKSKQLNILLDASLDNLRKIIENLQQ